MIFLGLGSSIGNAEKIFQSAEKALGLANVKVVQKSNILKNPPVGGIAKNEFSNAVWQVETALSPVELLKVSQQVEEEHGRTREKRWEDRTLDIDILIFHEEIVNADNLKIPHPQIANRLFVLQPLSELVDENFEIPTLGALGNLFESE
jgi:2-amino-4-hydroxy-6-hydroxymethyldihydropteridine diphosphokinase